MANFPQYYLVTSNYSDAWEGEDFAFVWRLNMNLHGENPYQISRNTGILNMMRRWCTVETIEEAWADTLTEKFKSLERIEDLDELHKFLKRNGCHL